MSGKRYKLNKKNKKNGKKFIFPKFLIAIIIFIIMFYLIFIYCPLNPIRYLRDLYIETAMTTSHHRYLAEFFIPKKIIDEVMNDKITTTDLTTDKNLINIPDLRKRTIFDKNFLNELKDVNLASYSEIKEDYYLNPNFIYSNNDNFDKPIDPNDLLDQKNKNVGDVDEFGNKIYINDLENGIIVFDIDKFGFKGKLALISNPKQVYLGYIPGDDFKGMTIQEFIESEDAVLGTNASGFLDPGGVGLGTDSSGLSYSKGEAKSTYKDVYNSFGFDKDDKFIIGHFDNWEEKGIRDGMQFNPAMIIDGVIQVNAAARMGLHPRTCIGQRADGVVALMVIDGRTAESGLGGSIKKAAEIMLSYGCINASNCDGGASTIMAYKGDIINDCSYKHKKGRYLPNAWLVRKRSSLNIPPIATKDQFKKQFFVSNLP